MLMTGVPDPPLADGAQARHGRELPFEGSWKVTGVVGPPQDPKATVSVWTPGIDDGDPGEANVDVNVTEPLTSAEAERLSLLVAEAATSAREIANWAVPQWKAAKEQEWPGTQTP
jgi:hypothetical protein